MDSKPDTLLQGLTKQESCERLTQDGCNELPTTKKRTFFHTLWEVTAKRFIPDKEKV